MKHDAMFLEQLQQEVPRKNLSSKATQRFEDTYQMLGVQQEAPVRRHRHKGPVLWDAVRCECYVPCFCRRAPSGWKIF